MKSTIYRLFIASALLASTTSCSEFLEKEPLSSGTEAIVFKNATQFQQAADAFISHLPGWNYDTMDRGTDIAGFSSNGSGTAPESDGNWSGNYNNIRQYCTLLEKAETYEGDQAEIAGPVGTAYFFRGFAYFNLLKVFGGVPIVDHKLDLDDPVLYGPRNSRYEVVQQIISDLNNAIERLPKESEISNDDKGRISKEGAQAFLGRVLLYEATWEKYVSTAADFGYDLDGDGVTDGAGSTKPEGYPSITEMLQTSVENSKAVMDEAANNGTYALWNECDTLSYYYLFNIDDTDGNIPNFMGAGKSTNKEFIIYSKYDYNLRRPGKNISHTVMVGSAAGMSAQFGESFLCRNGLPIRISYTGNMSDAQNNPQFSGWGTFEGEFYNRDYRFVSSTWCPDRVSWSSRTEDGRLCTVLNQPYATAVRPACDPENGDAINTSDPAYSSSASLFRPTLRNNATHSGYGSRKYLIEGANRPTNTESADWPILRLAEVYLNYAEAKCELQNGSLSNADLDISINLLRDRARVAHLSNELIEGVWDAGWWDYEKSKTVCHKMTILDEIRRERACELYGEGLRLDDLKRWGIAHINLRSNILGRHVLNTAYETHLANDATYYGQPCYDPENSPLLYGVKTDVSESDPDYGRSIAIQEANLHYIQRDYLSAIPLQQIRLNPALVQNPGW